MRTYQRIAEAAPGLPDSGIGSAYGERFAGHWLAGSLADWLGLSIPDAYRVLVAIAVVATLLALAAAVRRIGLATRAARQSWSRWWRWPRWRCARSCWFPASFRTSC